MALEFIGDVLGDDKSLGGDARLPIIYDARFDRCLSRFIDVGARHDNERIAPAQFEHRLSESFARGAPHRATRRGAPGDSGGYDERIIERAFDLIGTDEQSLK